ncbi:lysylphosphatidylglycerol synthase transmembrane domain-containing protein [Thioclava sp. JE_KL1]|uniref:lysylphosphatidylglycerol synthase transmembrane domain-containing protein n=1 Tax=Thioclava sp. JE_KL1 TaxID=2651187 RepID=UPI00128E6215|nr:lysylphosphatidylglycerol synthase transmembrane domain-containing protein [Thioclava sp. JE_KL1]MPQ95814.1 flippase-like domain-containing protein [Thioclava sp. JE_KL1]
MTHLALKLITVATVLAVTLYFVDPTIVLSHLRMADWRWLALAGIAVNLQTVLSALRWQVTARALGQRIETGEAIGEYYLAQLVNQTLPGGVLGDAGRAMRARRSANLLRSSQAVVIERLAGQIALAAVVLVALLLTGRLVWALELLGAALTLWLLARSWNRLARLLAPLRRALLGREVRARQIALGLSIVTCNLLAFAFAARAIGTQLSPSAIVTLVPLILSAMVIPLSIAGWGWREGAAAALFPLADATPEAGLAAATAFGATLIASALPGLGWVLLRRDAAAATTSKAK